MMPRNDLVKDRNAFCLAKIGEAYALYLPTGGSVTVSLSPKARYEMAWWNPANGRDGSFQGQAEIHGTQRVTAPGTGDWALRILGQAPRLR